MMRPSSSTTACVRLAGVSAVLAALALALGGQPAVSAQGKKESQVKLAATATKPDSEGRQVVTITMDINKGWHAYANPVKFEDLEAAQTSIKITSAKKLQDVQIKYPEGMRHVDGKDTYYVYEGKVEIQATVKRAPGDTGPLDVSVKYMTCNDKTCLPPEQVTLQVK